MRFTPFQYLEESALAVPLAALSPIDYGILLLYLAAVLGLGFYFSSRQKNSAEFILAGRSLGWLPLGLSLVAPLVAIVGVSGLPGLAYEQGLKCLVVPGVLWLAFPLIVFVVIPIQRGLAGYSLYEYLELRFDERVRFVASLMYLAWRLLWLAAIVCLPCQAAIMATGWNIPAWLLVLPLGLLATLYTFLGGMRAVAWNGVLQAAIISLAAAVVIGGVWLHIEGGPARVAEVADGLGRLQMMDLQFSWTNAWAFWGALAYWIVIGLSFFLADQIAGQRFLSAKSINAARNAQLAGTLALSLLLPGLIYAGLCLYTFYYDHPRAMDPAWVVNVDNKTRELVVGEYGQPLLDPRRKDQRVTWENIDRLVAEGRVLQPNNKEPFTSAADLVDPETNEVRIERLAMRTINADKFRGEMVVSQSAPAEMLPHFVAGHLSWGAAGIVIAAIIASVLAAFDSGLAAIGAVLVADCHRRFGWGREWLARRLGKSARQLGDADELQLARPLTLVLGGVATVLSMAAAWLGDRVGVAGLAGIPALLLSGANAIGAPLLAVFLLGMLTRRTTAPAAFVAVCGGAMFTVALTIVNRLALGGARLPPQFAYAEIWSSVFGALLTLALGYGLSFVLGRRRSNVDLRGLVAGCGTLGVRATEEAHPLISLPDEEEARKWR